jgi:cytochrome c-type biogenesis protein CcmH
MMGWLFLLSFAALTFGALWKSGLLDRTALEIAVVAILIGLAGYAWQGSPSLLGAPANQNSATG